MKAESPTSPISETKSRAAAVAPILTIIVIIVAWWCAAGAINSTLLFPSPPEVAKITVRLLSSADFYSALSGTVMRVAISFIASLAAGLVCAIIASRAAFFRRAFYPLVIIVRATPTMSVIFLCIIWFKNTISPMIIAFAVLFPQLYASILSAVDSVSPEIKEVAKVYRVPALTVLFDFYLPSVAARVYSDAVSAAALNVKLVIAAEALAQTALSMGGEMQIAKANLETATLFAYTVYAVAASYFIELIMRFIRFVARRLTHG